MRITRDNLESQQYLENGQLQSSSSRVQLFGTISINIVKFSWFGVEMPCQACDKAHFRAICSRNISPRPEHEEPQPGGPLSGKRRRQILQWNVTEDASALLSQQMPYQSTMMLLSGNTQLFTCHMKMPGDLHKFRCPTSEPIKAVEMHFVDDDGHFRRGC
jgi:hypothetical protein